MPTSMPRMRSIRVPRGRRTGATLKTPQYTSKHMRCNALQNAKRLRHLHVHDAAEKL